MNLQFPNSVFYASPLIYDINKDGEPDIGVTTFDGELIWLTENGMPLIGKSLKIPHLKVLCLLWFADFGFATLIIVVGLP